jgi:molybdopterin converting factor small subunit
MIVSVRYHGQLRQEAGVAAEDVAVEPGATVIDLLRRLAEIHPLLRPRLLDDAGRKQATVLVFVGDDQAVQEGRLSPGAEILLLTPIAGGMPCPGERP